MDVNETNEILLNKYCSALQNPNKRARKGALESIRKVLVGIVDENEVLVLYKTIQKDLVRVIRDESEACREYVISLITHIIKTVPKDESLLTFIFPEIYDKLASVEVKEPSEEVRLVMVILIHTIVIQYEKLVLPYFNDCIEILKKTIVDPYPKIKKESCECAADLGKALPMEFHLQSESLIKPMLQSLNHQHQKIRVAVIQSIGEIILHGNNNSITEVAGPLAERLFDQSPLVRITVARVVGMWLLKLRDRYSYFYRLIPLILTSLMDEVKSQAEESWKMWEEAGKQWALENEADIKDKLDFLPESSDCYPNGVRRPNIGCRELVQREMTKYIPGILIELTDWKVDIRVKSAQLLCATIQHAEQRITQSLAKILPPMCKAFCDEDKRVSVNIARSAELLGYFVPVEVYCNQILPIIEETPSAGNIGVLASAILYSPSESILHKLKEIADIIDRDDIRYTEKTEEQRQIKNLISAILKNCGDKYTNVFQNLCNVIICQLSVCHENTALFEEFKDMLSELKYARGTNQHLFNKCVEQLLQQIQPSVSQWTVYSPQLKVFDYILVKHTGEIINNIEIVLNILKTSVDVSMDAEVVLRILWSLYDIIGEEMFIFRLNNGKNNFYKDIITDVLPIQIVWRPGQSAEALRTAAAGCLNQGIYHLLRRKKSKSVAVEIFDTFFPHFLSLYEDPSDRTRMFTVETLTTLIKAAKSFDTLTVDHVNSLIPVAMKRLDDVHPFVRVKTVTLISVVYKHPTAVCSENVFSSLTSVLLIHLDEPADATRFDVLKTLKYIGRTNPEAVLNKISIDTFRDKKICTELVDFLKAEMAK